MYIHVLCIINCFFFFAVLFGYPPTEISSYNKTATLADVGIRRGDILILQELDIPRCGAAAETPSDLPTEEPPDNHDDAVVANDEGCTLSRR